MFFISSQEEFGLRFLIAIADLSPGREISLAELAEKEGSSLPYTRKIFGIMRQKGLVTASRGVQGGYSLSKKPEELTLDEIFNALSTTDNDFNCLDYRGKLEICANFNKNCRVKYGISYIQKRMEEILTGVTLKDLLEPINKAELKELKEVVYS